MLVVGALGWWWWQMPPAPLVPEALDGPRAPHIGGITTITIRADHVVTGDEVGFIAVRPKAGGPPTARWVAHDGPVRRAGRHGDGIYTVGADGTVATWDFEGRLGARFRLDERRPNDGAPFGDGFVVVSAGGDVTRIGPGGVQRHVRRFHDPAGFGVAIDPAGARFATTGRDGRVAVWTPERDEAERTWTAGDDAWLTRLAWHGDTIVGAGYDGRVHAWRAPDGDRRWTAKAGASALLALDLDESRVVVGDDAGIVHSWSPSDGAKGPIIRVDGGAIFAIALDGAEVWTGDASGQLHRWRIADATLPAH